MKTDFTIREAQQTDTIALKELFQNTVLAVNSKDYSQAVEAGSTLVRVGSKIFGERNY